MRSKAWLAASVWLRLARLPPPASRMRRSRRLRDTPEPAPGLLAHACLTEAVIFCLMGPKLRHTMVVMCSLQRLGEAASDELDRHDAILDEADVLTDKAQAGLKKAVRTEKRIIRS